MFLVYTIVIGAIYSINRMASIMSLDSQSRNLDQNDFVNIPSGFQYYFSIFSCRYMYNFRRSSASASLCKV